MLACTHVVAIVQIRVGHDGVHLADFRGIQPVDRDLLAVEQRARRLERRVVREVAQRVDRALRVVGPGVIPAARHRDVRGELVLHARRVVPGVFARQVGIGALIGRQAEPAVLARADLVVLRHAVAVRGQRPARRRRRAGEEVRIGPDASVGPLAQRVIRAEVCRGQLRETYLLALNFRAVFAFPKRS